MSDRIETASRRPPTIVLASASPRRRELLERLVGEGFDVVPTTTDETPRPGEDAGDYALRLAEAKARDVARRLSAGLVVGADTVVVLDGALMGKPANAKEATDHLRRLRGRRHDVATAVSIVDAADGRERTGIDWTAVWMRDYGEDEIAAYVASGDPYDKAGAYAIQSVTFRPVARIEGSESNVVGLPLRLTENLLAAFTERPPAARPGERHGHHRGEEESQR